MTYRVGEIDVSVTQESYLRNAKGATEDSKLLDLAYVVLTDGDLTSNNEELHPDWIPLIQKLRRNKQPGKQWHTSNNFLVNLMILNWIWILPNQSFASCLGQELRNLNQQTFQLLLNYCPTYYSAGAD